MKKPNYKYLVEGPRGGVLVCSTKAEAQQLTKNGGSFRLLTAAEKRAVDSQSAPRPKVRRKKKQPAAVRRAFARNPALGKSEKMALVELDAALAAAQKQMKESGIPSIRAAATRKVKHYSQASGMLRAFQDDKVGQPAMTRYANTVLQSKGGSDRLYDDIRKIPGLIAYLSKIRAGDETLRSQETILIRPEIEEMRFKAAGKGAGKAPVVLEAKLFTGEPVDALAALADGKMVNVENAGGIMAAAKRIKFAKSKIKSERVGGVTVLSVPEEAARKRLAKNVEMLAKAEAKKQAATVKKATAARKARATAAKAAPKPKRTGTKKGQPRKTRSTDGPAGGPAFEEWNVGFDADGTPRARMVRSGPAKKAAPKRATTRKTKAATAGGKMKPKEVLEALSKGSIVEYPTKGYGLVLANAGRVGVKELIDVTKTGTTVVLRVDPKDLPKLKKAVSALDKLKPGQKAGGVKRTAAKKPAAKKPAAKKPAAKKAAPKKAAAARTSKAASSKKLTEKSPMAELQAEAKRRKLKGWENLRKKRLYEYLTGKFTPAGTTSGTKKGQPRKTRSTDGPAGGPAFEKMPKARRARSSRASKGRILGSVIAKSEGLTKALREAQKRVEKASTATDRKKRNQMAAQARKAIDFLVKNPGTPFVVMYQCGRTGRQMRKGAYSAAEGRRMAQTLKSLGHKKIKLVDLRGV